MTILIGQSDVILLRIFSRYHIQKQNPLRPKKSWNSLLEIPSKNPHVTVFSLISVLMDFPLKMLIQAVKVFRKMCCILHGKGM